MKKLLALLLLSPLAVVANPTSGWQDSGNDSGGFLFLLGAWALILIFGGLGYAKDSYLERFKKNKELSEEKNNTNADINQEEQPERYWDDGWKYKTVTAEPELKTMEKKHQNRKGKIMNKKIHITYISLIVVIITAFSATLEYRVGANAEEVCWEMIKEMSNSKIDI